MLAPTLLSCNGYCDIPVTNNAISWSQPHALGTQEPSLILSSEKPVEPQDPTGCRTANCLPVWKIGYEDVFGKFLWGAASLKTAKFSGSETGPSVSSLCVASNNTCTSKESLIVLLKAIKNDRKLSFLPFRSENRSVLSICMFKYKILLKKGLNKGNNFFILKIRLKK